VIFVVLLYITLKYINKPIRRLKVAQKKKAPYFLDNPTNARENFFITYKGFLFEGEKYMNHSLKVVSIFIHPTKSINLDEMRKKDFQEIEKMIHWRYPEANIDWKSTEQTH